MKYEEAVSIIKLKSECADSIGECHESSCNNCRACISNSSFAKATKTVIDHADKYRWHDLRKNPDDLPETFAVCDLIEYSEAVTVWTSEKIAATAIFKRSEGFTGFVGDILFWGESNENIIAWRYIEPFEEAYNASIEE